MVAREFKAEALAAENVVCTCYELTRERFLDLMVQYRDLDFQQMLDAAGVGNKCTACRLDLELIYTENFDRLPPPNDAQNDKGLAPLPRQTLKEKLYDFMDRLGPMVPMPLRNLAPVIAGSGTKELLIVTNDPPLFAASDPVPACEVGVCVRDDQGRVVHRENYELASGAELNIDISCFLKPAKRGELPSVGSAEITRRWRAPGERGTTRPQFQILAPAGCGAVHTQAESGRGSTWYTALFRPKDERILLTLINPEGGDLGVSFTYPADRKAIQPIVSSVNVPAHGTILHEVVLPEGMIADGEPYSIRIDANGPHKCHILTADPKLTRFAVDHPAAG